ncbi:MAG TPA: RNA polymerase subunit sigma-24 [Chthoniobacterales bacterium]|nr:RNA polymerase subunit sigma-24 [Chthoniobacterales bacterium]
MTTRWSVVLACADLEVASCAAHDALSQLCQNYWRPIFAFVCRRGYSVSDAQDLTQDFFLAVIEGSLLDRADPERGKFRNLLLKALNGFLHDARDRGMAQKRGGKVQFVSWDDWAAEAPSRLMIPESAFATWPAERLFDLRWTATVVERALRRLAEECERHGRRRLYDVLSGSLMAERTDVSMAQLAGRTGLAEATVKRLLHQMRERYRALLREEVADTVEDPGSIHEEVRYLCSILASQTE